MPRHVLIDQIHLSFFVPTNLGKSEPRAIRRTLTGTGFQSRLYRAVQSVVSRFPALSRIRLTILR